MKCKRVQVGNKIVISDMLNAVFGSSLHFGHLNLFR